MHAGDAALLLFDLALIVVAARLAGLAIARIGQPPVIGEIIVGVLLGPTLLGEHSERLFPPAVKAGLAPLATLGLVLFMFGVGYELERLRAGRAGRTVGAVATGSMLLPFALAVPLGWWLAPRHGVTHVLPFVLFIGAAMSITAFPVLARILVDRRLQHTEPGKVALACAAVNDVAAWILLAGVLTLLGTATTSPGWLLLLGPYLVVMFAVVRPLLRRLAAGGRLTPSLLAWTLAGLLVSSGVTHALGLHLIFGAFLFGVVMPREVDTLREQVLRAVRPVADGLLLPVFFVVAGLAVDLSAIDAGGVWELAAVLAVASAGKLVGGYLPARLIGMPERDAGVLAVLLNTRGLTEIVIASVGLGVGLLDRRLYSIFVIMAIVTTMMAGPLLALLGRTAGPVRERPAAAERLPAG